MSYDNNHYKLTPLNPDSIAINDFRLRSTVNHFSNENYYVIRH